MIDIDLTNYISDYEVDKVIATFVGTLSIPAGGTNQADHALPIGAGRTFWAGGYTVNGGTQQNDIGALQYSGLTGVGLQARSYVGGIRIIGQNGTGSTATANYFIAVIASPETGIIPIIGTFAPRVTTYAFDSRENHQKITEDFVDTSGLIRINHSHGASPKFRMFFVWTDGFMYEASVAYSNSIVAVADGFLEWWQTGFPGQAGLPVYVRFYDG